MKKTIAVFAIVALAACSGGSSNETTIDSTATQTDSIAAQVDTSAVTATDSTTAEIPAAK